MPKVSIIGAGNVGSTIALNLVTRQITDIVFVDLDIDMACGKALDLQDYQATIHGNIKITGTDDYSCIADSDIIVITAGKPRKKNTEMTREELFEINSEIIKKVCAEIKQYSPESIVITVTNPVDKMNKLVFDELQGDRKKIIGAGSLLDTARLKTIIAEELNVPVSAINALVKGPHNDNMLPLYSQTTINGKSIFELLSEEKLMHISQKVKNRGKQIVDLMGSGYYAISNVVSQMIESILLDKNELLPASIHLEGEYGISGISVGVPVRLGREGADIIEIDYHEKQEFLKAVEKLK